jgi:hypothetical protein
LCIICFDQRCSNACLSARALNGGQFKEDQNVLQLFGPSISDCADGLRAIDNLEFCNFESFPLRIEVKLLA